MTTYDFLLQLLDLDQDTKIVANNEACTEMELRLFRLPYYSLTVKQLVRQILQQLKDQEIALVNPVNIKTQFTPSKPIKSIVFHNDHFRKNRFYEITTE